MARTLRQSNAEAMSHSPIRDRQNTADALKVARAFHGRYRAAKLWHAARLGGGVTIGVLGLLLALIERSTSDYVAAVAAGWLVLSRLVFIVQERQAQMDGARAQEVFDTNVFELPWRTSLVGAHPDPEDLNDWAGRQPENNLRDWYSDAPAVHPVDVLISQRATLKWAKKDHSDYARYLRFGAYIVFGATIVTGLVASMGLGEYLLRLGLPAMPAVLDMVDVANDNRSLGKSRGVLAERADALYNRARVGGAVPAVTEARDLQDGIFVSRTNMGVPGWFYSLTRERRQRNMEQVTLEQARALPVHLQL